jgi:hypothetical protein
MEWKISVIRRKGSAIGVSDGGLEERLEFMKGEPTDLLGHGLLGSLLGEIRGLHVPHDSHATLGPTGEDEVAAPRRPEVTGLLGLDRHGIRMTVRALICGRAVMDTEVSGQSGVVVAHGKK